MYIGIGYDAHRFKKGRKLVLGGVQIPAPAGLDGHSDADVLVHALMDALLGAAGLEDIGHLFPNTDPAYRGISSILLLKKVAALLKRRKLTVVNADVALIAEKPKIATFIPEMKRHLGAALSLDTRRLAIKATTNEKMGFIGRGEGIAAIAVASLKKK
jgi:2-C-methyl-D-erythritol 2,4-cyclodiphosphate synthase